MTSVRPPSKFVQLCPLALASVLSMVLVSTLYFTSDKAQARRGDTDAKTDSIVYVDVMPRINRKPAPTLTAATPPGPTDAPFPPDTLATLTAPAAPDAAPVKTAPHVKTTTAPATRTVRNTVATRTNLAVAPKVEPVKVESAVANVQSNPALVPPMPIPPMQIVNADMQTAAPEPTRVFGMRVPAPVVGVARFPAPVIRVGVRIVEKVAGAAGAAISDFGR